ncbi:ricin-type beta-trefoil lectin domain protein [Streptomyces spongiae]|uniref:ricin-type beta-trefoil lectin domain protein n=1 Tax=Streptomyces spongiae TaxID=565072 RepID=UPI001D14DAAC|nr:ricin-type beta-trefoil lectin domain protein [Streptomyces spongiae]
MTPGVDFVFTHSEPMEREEERGDAVPSADELLTLHGRSVLDYAALCTVPRRGAAERLAGHAFRNTYGDAAPHVGIDFPWRPRLLAAVLDAAREWSADDRRSSLHPDLRDGATSDARRAATGTGGGSGARSLVLRALRNLPDRAHVLLWHTAVEGEEIEAVALLLGAEPSQLNPERARTLLRDECVRVHLDLAPDERCRRLNRLIDVHARRGSIEMMAGVRDHLDGCAYCRAAVDQLDQSPDRLPALLADAVLGFRAADYLATRPARQVIASARARSEPAPQPADEEAQPTASGGPALRRRRWTLLVASGVVLCGVVAASPMALSGAESDREAVVGPVPGPTRSPSGSAPEPSAVPPSPGTSSAPGTGEATATRLRNVRTGLCLDLRASTELVGVPAVTAECGGSATQMWWLEDGGRLRNQAAPELCLNAEPQGTVALRPCTDPEGREGEESGDTRYDLAVDGLLTLVAEPGVAVTPVRRDAGAVILLEPVPQDRVRRSQRWRTDEGFDRGTSPSAAVREVSAAG